MSHLLHAVALLTCLHDAHETYKCLKYLVIHQIQPSLCVTHHMFLQLRFTWHLWSIL